MKKSKAETALTRRRIIEAAALQFRRNGIHETGIADVMAAAGLTQGGFYKHFHSKSQLVAECCGMGMNPMLATAADAAERPGTDWSALEKIIEDYLSVDHRDDRSGGCPLTSLGSELARADTQTRENASAGFQKLVETIAGEFRTISPEAAKARAVFALSAMVGAVTISRIVTDPELSDFILEQTKKQLMRA
jgi:TetR/AcrR family transcriptional regulator, transcriptional repressor for nem operon